MSRSGAPRLSARQATQPVRGRTWRVPPRLLAVVLSTAVLWVSPAPAQEGRPLFPEEFTREEFTQRREAIYAAIGPAAAALVQGASGAHSSTRFRQSNEFYYLTGVETPNAYLLLDGRQRRATLYLPARLPDREATDGRVLSADDAELVLRLTGMDAVAAVGELAEHVGRRLPAGTTIYTLLSPAEGHSESRGGILRAIADQASDPWDGRPSREGHFASLLRQRFPFFEIRDLTPIIDELRLLKSPAEIAMIRRAGRMSGEALMEAVRSTLPGVREAELDAVARFIFVRHGAQGEGYRAIVASGSNAWFAHHRASGKVMHDGELVLMDYCPDLGYYRCDVTRMWPVNGRFTPVQRELYGFYLGFYEAILSAMQVGRTPQQVKQHALVDIDRILAATRFSKAIYEHAARSFVESFRRGAGDPLTRLGHGVGLSTHDPGNLSLPLQEGMVFVIEPQFRVPQEQLYFRLEDTIAITATGVEILSDFVPRDIASIERLMTERGLLQTYPPIATAAARQ